MGVLEEISLDRSRSSSMRTRGRWRAGGAWCLWSSPGPVHRLGVVEGGGGHDVPGADVFCHQLHDLHTGMLGQAQPGRPHGRDGAVAPQAHTDGLGETVHGVGCKHARTRTASGAGPTLDFLDICIAATAVCTHDHGVDQIYSLAVEITGFHRASGYKNRRNIQTHSSHQHARSDFVTITDTTIASAL